MLTQILKPDGEALALARRIIEGGGLVGFPTETVYGLGANAFDGDAVRSVYEVKGRPQDNPLIVHVHKDYDISKIVCGIPAYAEKLAQKYLPGPLTMVFRSRGTISPVVSCGLDTVGIRVPSHPAAQQFLRCVGLPIAAPSANISKHVSPVTAQHVYADLNGRIPLILDGGRCTGGIESTVLDCTGEVPCILRSGLVTKEMIAEVAGDCKVFIPKAGEKVRSPGMKYKHYSPRCRTMLFSYADRAKAYAEYTRLNGEGQRAYLMCDGACAAEFRPERLLALGDTPEQIAANLYEKLREGEQVADIIIAVAPEEQGGVMAGVMNRLTKACGG
ncbi:MAG TPA: threonylcarbamoyl-AMP synthase [Candidatus Coproplasma avistercoris]|nr:threonylcarbamoyl-AMP synthase [Candidatus Coproplasma avistercoris]